MVRKIYDIIEEPRNDIYSALIDYCFKNSHIVQFVLRADNMINDSARMILKKFQSELTFHGEVNEWPGTKLTAGSATIFKFRITIDLVNYIKTEVDSLYRWQHPEYFEDICFLRSDGQVLLATISHENDSYLEISTNEYDELLQCLPSLKVSEHSD